MPFAICHLPCYNLSCEIYDAYTPGGIEFDLSDMDPPMRDAGKNETPSKVNNLFKRKWMKGWWPVYNRKFDDPVTVSY